LPGSRKRLLWRTKVGHERQSCSSLRRECSRTLIASRLKL
jgi:hypothetical protein